MIRHLLSSTLLAALLLTGPLALTGCDRAGNALVGTKLNLENYGKITTGMSKAQAQAILGSASTENTEDKLIYKRTTWTYTEGDKFVKLTFKNDELDSKDSNLTK